MLLTAFKLSGGIGLFLIGMVLLTDGLKAFAGEALRKALVRFTGTPLKAFASGAGVTLLVQSSSATTVTLIGFVSAGLLTFPQAVGVVMGASLGTTGTGWVVALLGLKISLGLYALPLVGLGALGKLLARGRWQMLGMAMAGFGLIFVGIDTLQLGMQGLSAAFNLAALPTSGVVGKALTVLVGLAMTMIMQSSSAAVATTLTALHAGAVSFEQAGVLVIGAAVGTTVTGALAAIGGSVPAKRTAVAHVLFNLATGVIALLLLPALLAFLHMMQERAGLDPGATSLAAFHTTFIALGVVVFLPFVRHFSAWIEKLLPHEGSRLTRHLGNTLLQLPAVAFEATSRALRDCACDMFDNLDRLIDNVPGSGNKQHRIEVREALNDIQEFLAKIPTSLETKPLSPLRVAQMHALDHLARLHTRLKPTTGVQRALGEPALTPAITDCKQILRLAKLGLQGHPAPNWQAEVEQLATHLGEQRRKGRLQALRGSHPDARQPLAALELVDAMRWLDRVGFHTWRICYYLTVTGQNRGGESKIDSLGAS